MYCLFNSTILTRLSLVVFLLLPFILTLFWISVKFSAIMNSDFKFEQGAYIKIRTLLGFAPKDVLADLEIVYKYSRLSYSTVKDWAKRFRGGQEPLEDGFRSGRPESAVTSGNIFELRGCWKTIPHVMVEEIAVHVGISTGASHSIPVDEIGVSKICSRWIPHSLSSSQKDNRVKCAKSLLAEYEHVYPKKNI